MNDIIDDELEADWDAYWTWRTEHPDEFEKARRLEEPEEETEP